MTTQEAEKELRESLAELIRFGQNFPFYCYCSHEFIIAIRESEVFKEADRWSRIGIVGSWGCDSVIIIDQDYINQVEFGVQANCIVTGTRFR